MLPSCTGSTDYHAIIFDNKILYLLPEKAVRTFAQFVDPQMLAARSGEQAN